MPDTAGNWVQAPYFFLSYAHTPNGNARERDDIDRHVRQFFQDICQHIMHLTNLRRGIPAGYMDVDMRPGDFWKPELLRNLAECQVLLALWSPRYFDSEWCGREWDAFERRQRAHRDQHGSTANAIVPVLWAQEDLVLESIPEQMKEIHYLTPDARLYREEGLYGLLVARKGDYSGIALEIARTIINVARATQLARCDVSLFDGLKNAFEEMRREEGGTQ
jgi:TIR domain-containing protein